MSFKFNPFTGKLCIATNPGGSNTQVQYNDSGVFNGAASLLFNKATAQVTVFRSASADNNPSFNVDITASGATGTSRFAMGLALKPGSGYVCGNFINGLSFDVSLASNESNWYQDSGFGFRPGGARGIGGYSRGLPTSGGVNTGGLYLAGRAAYNFGSISSGTIPRTGVVNIGASGFALNSAGGVNFSQIAGLFMLYASAAVPPGLVGVNCALLADNCTTTGDILRLRDNSVNVFTVSDGSIATLGEGLNFVLGTTTGTKFGTASTQKLGFYGASPVIRPSAYTVTNAVDDRAYDANATSVDELADVLGTLIADFKLLGLIG